MFERYTEKARRTIFFARYEAVHYGSPYIETEHILLGLFRENGELVRLMPVGSGELIRKRIDDHTTTHEKIPTSVDVPLSNECKRVLAFSAEEAERLAHRHIGTEHLFLGLFREKGCFAAEVLHERGLVLEKLREHFAKVHSGEGGTSLRFRPSEARLEIHGIPWHSETIRERVKTVRRANWHWRKQPWKARDVAISKDGQTSFDVSLALDAKNFDLLSAGWKKDHCPICFWELFESENQPEHSAGYTNGRDWVCNECFEKFLQKRDYFETSYPEIT